MESDFWPYVAGLIDGEGYLGLALTFKRGKKWTRIEYDPCLSITQISSRDHVLHEIREKTGHGRVAVKRRANARQAQTSELCIESVYGVRELVTKTLPFLRIKKPQAVLMMKVLDMLERPTYPTNLLGKKSKQRVKEEALELAAMSYGMNEREDGTKYGGRSWPELKAKVEEVYAQDRGSLVITLSCSGCGKPVHRYACVAKRKTIGTFCSRDCHTEYQRTMAA